LDGAGTVGGWHSVQNKAIGKKEKARWIFHLPGFFKITKSHNPVYEVFMPVNNISLTRNTLNQR
jgi:hypothetical protein